MRLLFVILQYLLPQHWLSRLAGLLADYSSPWFRRRFIRWFIGRYQVDMSEAANPDPDSYENFNAFFTRSLKPGLRPVAAEPGTVVSPADGVISQLGEIGNGQLLQAKGQWYSLVDLLGGRQLDALPFQDGNFITVYLSPRDYHRVHMPVAGRLLETLYIPGRLFSVNQVTADAVPGLFARNERLVCRFETHAGPMVLIMVGAMIVAGIDTVWGGQARGAVRHPVRTDFRQQAPALQLAKGEEMARFRLGSTVILLFGPGAVQFAPDLQAESPLRMGEVLAAVKAGA